MSNGRISGQPIHDVRGRKYISDEAQAPVGIEVPTVVADDSRRLLSAVLKGVKAQSRVRRCIDVSEYGEYAAAIAGSTVAFRVCGMDEPGHQPTESLKNIRSLVDISSSCAAPCTWIRAKSPERIHVNLEALSEGGCTVGRTAHSSSSDVPSLKAQPVSGTSLMRRFAPISTGGRLLAS